jgi:hypothetical protein
MVLLGQLVMIERQFDVYITHWRAGCWSGAEWQAGVLTDNPAQAVIRDGDRLISADLRPGRNMAIGEQASGLRYIVHGDGISGRGPVAVPITTKGE